MRQVPQVGTLAYLTRSKSDHTSSAHRVARVGAQDLRAREVECTNLLWTDLEGEDFTITRKEAMFYQVGFDQWRTMVMPHLPHVSKP